MIHRLRYAILLPLLFSLSGCFFLILPIPNLSKPASLQKTIETLEKSDQVKALAFAAESGVFGSRMYVWGSYTSQTESQSKVDSTALSRCENALEKYKLVEEGGVRKYNFGEAKCELYKFANAGTGPQVQQPAPRIEQIVITAPSEPATNPTATTEKTLQDLKKLLDQKLITETEYQEKRKKVLDSL